MECQHCSHLKHACWYDNKGVLFSNIAVVAIAADSCCVCGGVRLDARSVGVNAARFDARSVGVNDSRLDARSVGVNDARVDARSVDANDACVSIRSIGVDAVRVDAKGNGNAAASISVGFDGLSVWYLSGSQCFAEKLHCFRKGGEKIGNLNEWFHSIATKLSN